MSVAPPAQQPIHRDHPIPQNYDFSRYPTSEVALLSVYHGQQNHGYSSPLVPAPHPQPAVASNPPPPQPPPQQPAPQPAQSVRPAAQQQKYDRLVVRAQPNTAESPDGTRSYTPLKLVGDGSFGTVWLCDWHGPLPPGTPLSPMQCGQGAKQRPEWTGKRLVAVKRLNRRWPGGWDECSQLKELESLRRISHHPSIIPLYDAFILPQTLELYFVFESMEGNLYQLIKSRKGRVFASGLIASIFRQTIGGLDHMHAQGYFHRDMKPENLLVTTIGIADYAAVPGRNGVYRPGTGPGHAEKDVQVILKLADFGLAREITSEPPYTEYVSTRWYRAPEVLLRARNYSAPVDLWAFGTIMAELVTLRPLFPGTGEIDQLGKIRAILGDWGHEYGYGGGEWRGGLEMLRKMGYNLDAKMPERFETIFDPSVPPSLVECIADLLRYDPARRLTAPQVAAHRYLQDTAHAVPPQVIPGAMPAAPLPHMLNHSASQSSLERQAHAHVAGLPISHSQQHLLSQISPLSPRSIPPSHSHSPAYPKPPFPADLPTPPPHPHGQQPYQYQQQQQQQARDAIYPLTPSPSANQLVEQLREMEFQQQQMAGQQVPQQQLQHHQQLQLQLQQHQIQLQQQQQQQQQQHVSQQQQQQQQQHAQSQMAQNQQQQKGVLGSLGKKAKGWGLGTMFRHDEKQPQPHAHPSDEHLTSNISTPSLKRPQSGSGSTGDSRSLAEPSPIASLAGGYPQHVGPSSLPPLHIPSHISPPALQHNHSHASNNSQASASSGATQDSALNPTAARKAQRQAEEHARKMKFERDKQLQRERARAQMAKRQQEIRGLQPGYSEFESINARLDTKGKGRAGGDAASLSPQRSRAAPSIGHGAPSVRTHSSMQDAEERRADLAAHDQRKKARRREGDGDHSMSSADMLSVRSVQTFSSVGSDPGPQYGQHQPNAFGGLRGTTSFSSLRTSSSTYSNPISHHSQHPHPPPSGYTQQTTPLEQQFITDFNRHANVASPLLPSSNPVQMDVTMSPSPPFEQPPPQPFGNGMGNPPPSSFRLPPLQQHLQQLPPFGHQPNGVEGTHPMFRLPPHPEHVISPLHDMQQTSPPMLPPFSDIANIASQGEAHQQHQMQTSPG